MTYNRQSAKQIIVFSFVFSMLFSAITISPANVFAEDTAQNDFIQVANDTLQNDPLIAQILKNIEKSRQEFSNVQQNANQEKIIDKQRSIAQQTLERELEQMLIDNKDFTPLAAFNKFLSKVSDENTKTIFKGLFDYQQEKINAARNAMNAVLDNGGTLQDAREAYNKAAMIPRSDMISLVKDLNIQAGFSDPAIQINFDDNGNLPRYDSEQESIDSFVDLTSHAQNVNVSANSETPAPSVESKSDLIQQLLDEIQSLKDKINKLEQDKNPAIQQAVLEGNNLDSVRFASWVSDYSQGLGHHTAKIKDPKTIPVNALNKPNSYTDINNSLTLGRQGQVTLGFSEPISDKLIVYEASTEKNIRERAIVEVSTNGKDWVVLGQTQYSSNGSFVHEYGYDLTNIGCITHVRITDNAPSMWGDGFDVDAVGATKTCTNTA